MAVYAVAAKNTIPTPVSVGAESSTHGIFSRTVMYLDIWCDFLWEERLYCGVTHAYNHLLGGGIRLYKRGQIRLYIYIYLCICRYIYRYIYHTLYIGASLQSCKQLISVSSVSDTSTAYNREFLADVYAADRLATDLT